MSTDLQPDVPAVLQEEDDGGLTVPVCLVEQKSPLRVQALPRKAGANMTRPITTTPSRVLRADPRRASALLVCASAFYVAFSRAGAQETISMTLWPANVPLDCEATTDIYVRTVTSTADLGIATYLWAEGE